MSLADGVGCPFNLARHCLTAGGAHADKPALEVLAPAGVANAEIWTYAHLEDAVLRVAGGFQAFGLTPGARVLIRLDNNSSYPIVFLGAIAAGLIAIPASSQLTDIEALFLLTDSSASAVVLAAGPTPIGGAAGVRVIADADVRQMLLDGARGDYAATLSEDPAYLIYTSGTTARPKGVVHAQRVALGRKPMVEGWTGITQTDRVLHAGAFNWTYTLGVGLIDPWINGATSVIYTGDKAPGVWPKLIRDSGATIFAAVPGLMRQILKYAPPGSIDLGALRHGLIAGERPPDDLFNAWRARTGTELYEALGMSEISTYISTGPSTPRKPGATGKPQPGRRVAILAVEDGVEPLPLGEQGLIAVHRSDPGLMLGYWNRAAEEAEVMRGAWFIGGDLGSMDADGYVTHLGRANDVMKALGYRVSPQEVEAVLAQCPGVADVACAEVCVRDGVSVIGAFIIRAAGANVTADAVMAYAAARLAAYKQPRDVAFVEQFPRTANGKVRRRALAFAREAELRHDMRVI